MNHIDARRLIAISSAVAAAGFLWQSRITPESDYLSGVLGPALVICAGLGLLITPITTLVTSGVSETNAGAASGLMNATRQVGRAFGPAILVGIGGSSARTPELLANGNNQAFLTIAVILVLVVAAAFVLPPGQESTEALDVEHPRGSKSS